MLAGFGKLLQGSGNFHSIYFKHITAARLQVMLGDEYEDYFKFSIVRNPWDWLVSMYEFNRGFCYPFIYGTPYSLHIPDKFQEMPFDYWLHWFHDTFHMQQFEIISDSGGKIAVDKVFRYEELHGCIEEVGRILNLDLESNLPKLKNSDRKELAFYYDSGATIDAVGKYFSRDIELFGYSFDDLFSQEEPDPVKNKDLQNFS